MDQRNLDGLVAIVSTLGWKPQMNEVIGADTAAFYDELTRQNPQRAYEVALQSGDPVFLQAVTERIIQSTVGGTDLENTIRGMYLNVASPVVSQPVAAPVSTPVPSSGFSIESLEDRYRVNGVSYQGNPSTVDISKALLDNGASHVQVDWIEQTRQGEWKLPSGPLYFAVLAALYDNKNAGIVEEVREMLARDFKSYFMMTSTRVRYAREGMDTVVHDFGYVTERAEEMNIVGSDGYVSGTSGFGVEMRALVGIDDCQKIEQVGRWITGKKPYLYRLNSKPKKDIERALVLDGDDVDRFYVYADDFNVGWARGMVAHVAKNSP